MLHKIEVYTLRTAATPTPTVGRRWTLTVSGEVAPSAALVTLHLGQVWRGSWPSIELIPNLLRGYSGRTLQNGSRLFGDFCPHWVPSNPTISLCSWTGSPLSARDLTSSNAAANSSAFSCACPLETRTRDCNSSTASNRSNSDAGLFKCLLSDAKAAAVPSKALSCWRDFTLSSNCFKRSSAAYIATKRNH